MAELKQDGPVADVASQGEVRHLQVAMHEHHDQLALMVWQAESQRGVVSQPATDLTVILFKPLARVVQQQRQVQQLFVMNLTVRLSERAIVRREPLGRFDRPQRVFINREVVVLVELQQAANVSPAGQHRFHHACVMQIAQCLPERAGVLQQREERLRCLRRELSRRLQLLRPNELQQSGGDSHAAANRREEQLQDTFQGAAHRRAMLSRDIERFAADVIDVVDAVGREVLHQPVSPRRGLRTRDEPPRDGSHGRAVLEVLLHEPFHGSLSGKWFDLALSRNSQLIVARKNVLFLVSGKMQVDAQRGQEFVSVQQPPRVILIYRPVQSERVKITGPVCGEANPTNQMQVAQRSQRSLHIGFELLCRRRLLGSLGVARGHGFGNELPRPRFHRTLKLSHELLAQRCDAPQRSHVHE